MKHLADDQILALINKETESEKGYRFLMFKYQEKLYWHIRRLVQNHEDANDVLQNTFIKVFRNIDKFRGDSKLYTWLYRIASNESLTFLDKRSRKLTESIDNEELNLTNQLKADPYFDGDEIQLQLQLALAGLPNKQKLVFCMRYFEEMDYKEISEILETSVGALKASYHHAAKKIEAYLKNVETL